jgi:hypothetical protein
MLVQKNLPCGLVATPLNFIGAAIDQFWATITAWWHNPGRIHHARLFSNLIFQERHRCMHKDGTYKIGGAAQCYQQRATTMPELVNSYCG